METIMHEEANAVHHAHRIRTRRRRLWMGMPALLCVALVSACATGTPAAAPSTATGLPCAQDPTCTVYSGASAGDDGTPVAWIAAHPLAAVFYADGSDERLSVDAPCTDATLPMTRSGSTLTIDTEHIVLFAGGCVANAVRDKDVAFVRAVLLSKNVTGTISSTSKSITLSAGSKSITFVTR
jgi:hypothetical protein